MTVVLVDADHITYRAAASCSPTKLKPFLESKEDAIHRAEGMMLNLVDLFPNASFETYIAGQGNWRYEIYPEYKANRKDIPKPHWLEDVREYLLTHWKAQIVNDIEVDDACGIRLTEEGANAVCVSLDKDLLTIPGTHYNFVKQTTNVVDKTQALRYFYKQVITGDASDNIPGFDGKLRSITPKFVEAILQPLDTMTEELEMYKYCCDVYADKVLDESVSECHLERNAKVLYIQRKEGDQWHPPGQKDVNELSL